MVSPVVQEFPSSQDVPALATQPPQSALVVQTVPEHEAVVLATQVLLLQWEPDITGPPQVPLVQVSGLVQELLSVQLVPLAVLV
jgi:hypothetical protein